MKRLLMLWCLIIGLVEVGVANGIRNQLASGNMDMLHAISTDTTAIDNEYVRVFKREF